MKYIKKQSEHVQYIALNDKGSKTRANPKIIALVVVVTITVLCCCILLWRLLQPHRLQISGLPPEINCETCVNTTTVTQGKNDTSVPFEVMETETSSRFEVFTTTNTLDISRENTSVLLQVVETETSLQFEVFTTTNALDISTEISTHHTVSVQSVLLNIPSDARWDQKGITVAGGHGRGSATNQLSYPYGLFIDDDDEAMIITDYSNHRIVKWKIGEKSGHIVAGGSGQGDRLYQLSYPTDALVDKNTDSLIICDQGNKRVLQWSLSSGTTLGTILKDDIHCYGLATDYQRYLYISDEIRDEVRRYRIGEKSGILVAGGGFGEGHGLKQLNCPTYLFVDQHQTVYVSDSLNHRVMKWHAGAKEGIIVAGGQNVSNARAELWDPKGVFVDASGIVYIADVYNHRVVRWPQGAKQGTVIVGGNYVGARENQFNELRDLSFDRHGNLYTVDHRNHRIQRFSLK
ncbi:unnamed protein product [Rotaria socialis]|uniref:NHL repeat-containing protein n=2 Tax=Rotaria socialis TaxID=392032 RepID=A0A817UN27_9BILA|nr:unnamed protein product [Rotaria socialis]CAF3395754.1 unnamed protein product [Rotaria socialis]CAF4517822.1 unnamed protein product [Rotaria socialis]